MSREISDLTPRMQQKYRLFEFKMKEGEGRLFMVTSTYRSQVEQDTIYEQGRTTPGKIVTWTRNSRHTGRKAFDIAILSAPGKIVWDVKVDIDKDKIPDYREAGMIGESCGLTWGGRWKNPDFPHFEDNGQDLEVA